MVYWKIEKDLFIKLQEKARAKAFVQGSCGGWWDFPPFLSYDLEEVKEYYKNKNIILILK